MWCAADRWFRRAFTRHFEREQWRKREQSEESDGGSGSGSPQMWLRRREIVGERGSGGTGNCGSEHCSRACEGEGKAVGEGIDRRAPPGSEREGGIEGAASWVEPKRIKGEERAKGKARPGRIERGRGNSFLFFNKFSKLIFKLNLDSNPFYTKPHIT